MPRRAPPAAGPPARGAAGPALLSARRGGRLLARLAWLRPGLAVGYAFCGGRERRLRPAEHNGSLDHVHVAFSTDATHFVGLLAAMVSVVQHLSSPGRCTLHLAVPAADLPAAHLLARCLRRALPGARPRLALHGLRPLPFPLAFYQLPLAMYWTRLFLHEYLPTAPRVIWLDHDVIVRADVAELYKMHMEHAIAGAPEFVLPHFVRTFTFRDHIRECPHAAAYAGALMDSATFNTGVLVMDLERWRAEGLAARVMEWAVLTNGCFLDQLALNLAFRERVDWLDWRWNARPNGSAPTPTDCLEEVRIFHWNTYPNPKYWMSCASNPHMGDEHIWKPYLAQQECGAVAQQPPCPA